MDDLEAGTGLIEYAEPLNLVGLKATMDYAIPIRHEDDYSDGDTCLVCGAPITNRTRTHLCNPCVGRERHGRMTPRQRAERQVARFLAALEQGLTDVVIWP